MTTDTNTTTSTVLGSRQHNDRFTPKGTMPKDMLKRHKLTGNVLGDYSKSHNRGVVSRLAKSLKTYRAVVHGSIEKRLPASLRQTVHYFAQPQGRQDYDRTTPRSTDNNTTT